MLERRGQALGYSMWPIRSGSQSAVTAMVILALAFLAIAIPFGAAAQDPVDDIVAGFEQSAVQKGIDAVPADGAQIPGPSGKGKGGLSVTSPGKAEDIDHVASAKEVVAKNIPEDDSSSMVGSEMSEAKSIAKREGTASDGAAASSVSSARPSMRVRPIQNPGYLGAAQANKMRDTSAVIDGRESIVSPGQGLRAKVVFGASYPVLVCKYDLVCLIEMEDGEVMQDTPLLSDPVRWELTLRIRDVAPVKTYVAVKPRPDAGEATLSLFTNRRAYVVLLNPDPIAHTPILSFHYPDTEQRLVAERIEQQKQAKALERQEAAAVQAAKKTSRRKKIARSGLSTTNGAVPADELDFNFRISGKARFKPVRVYTDGRKTYVDFPASYRGEVPTLVATSGNTNSTVNTRISKGGQQLIADKVLHSFTLIAANRKIHVKRGS